METGPANGTPSPTPAEQPATQPGPVEPALPEETERPSTPPPLVMLNHFRLLDASFDFFDNYHRHVVSVKGINVDSRYPTAEAVNGVASMSLVTIQNMFYIRDWQAAFTYTPKLFTLFNASSTIASGFYIRDWQAAFTYTPKLFTLFNASSTIASGTATGGLRVKIAEPYSPFDVDVDFSGIDVEHLISDAGIMHFQASGALAGSLHLQGDLHNANSAAGAGKFIITNLRVTRWELFQMLGQALHNDKLQQIDFTEAYANYHIADGKVYLDELTLKSPMLMLSSQGVAEISGGLLALKSRLTISGDIARQIPDFLMDGFGKDATSGARYIDFNVYGTLNSPKTDLLKVIGKGLGYKNLEKGAGSILKNLFGGKASPPPPAQTIPPPQPATSGTSPAPAASLATP
jgi:hypothetical protein